MEYVSDGIVLEGDEMLHHHHDWSVCSLAAGEKLAVSHIFEDEDRPADVAGIDGHARYDVSGAHINRG